jgi:alpha-beta hydrolase superfamily lysophospholipase
LAAGGYSVYAIDHRGHGRSAGSRALVDRLTNAAADLDRLIDLARGAHPDVPLILLGHSLGGTIALLYCAGHQSKLDGLILSGPLVVLDPPPAPAARLAARALSALAPRLPAIAVDPALVSRDAREVEAYRTDPLVHHGRLPLRTVAEIATVLQLLPDQAAELEIPLLVAHGSEDRLAPLAGGRLVYEQAASSDKTMKVYDGFFHEILNELPEDRERVLADILGWLDAHTAQRPV